jgi:UDP-N-acetylglucosamine 2-epimerase
MQHPVTTEYEDSLDQITETLTAIEKLAHPTFWFWPNVDAGSDRISKGIRHFRETHDIPFIYFFKNLSPEDFLRLLIGAKCLVGNSSVGIREASFLGVPTVNIGNRQIGRDRGPNVIDTGYFAGAITDAIKKHLANGKYTSSALYGDGAAGGKIANLLATVPLKSAKQLVY